jgi:Polyketide cyclase / dehydrase and lipid transport
MNDSAAQLQTVSETVDLLAAPDQVWALIGRFGGMWHPWAAKIELTGEGIGQVRTIDTIDGKQIVERLEAIDNAQQFYRYAMISGIPATAYTGTLGVKPKGGGSSVEWLVQYQPAGASELAVKTAVSSLISAGLDALKTRFGAAQ